MSYPVRARLAPSPTGKQHLGNARTFLIAWLSARSQNGSIILRIEDIDSPRVRPEATQQIYDDLKWLGLDWDGTPTIQTHRIDRYEAVLKRLQAQELVYPCTCTRSDIAAASSAPHMEHEGPAYPGTCAHRHVSDAETIADRPYAWRFRVTDSPDFIDGFYGLTQCDIRRIGGDFVVWKSSKSPAYQLAVVVDDAEMGITEVVRGDDLIPSTPRQILLYRALGWQEPKFIHIPLVVGPDGGRLAKRHGEARISSYREQGISPEKILGFLAHSCGWIERPEPITAKELIALYRLDTIPKKPLVLDRPDLDSLFQG